MRADAAARHHFLVGRQEGRWPSPVRLGPNTVAWDEAEVEAAIDALPRSAYKK